MTSNTFRGWIVALVVAASVIPAAAQEPTVQLETRGTTGTITANGQAVTLSNIGGLASLAVQTTGTFNLTWELQCSVDGVTFDADDEVPVTLLSSAPTPADSVATNAEGIYLANIAGCSAARVIATTFSSGTLTATLTAVTPGGGSGGGGGGGASAVSITQGGNTAAVNASSQLSVNCANCSGTGASDVEGSTFTLGSDSVAPMGGYVDETAPTNATEDRMSTPRLTIPRALHINPRDATNGAELFGTAAAAADNTANPTLGGARAFLHIFDGATWDRWTGAVTQSGTWNIGTVTTVTGVTTVSTVSAVTNVGTIGTSVTPGTSAAHLGKAIDAVVGASDTGVASLMQRVDSPTTLTPASGDYAVPRLDSLGRQYVNCATGCAGSGVTDNAAFTAGSGTINAIGAFFDDTSSATATENSAAILRMTQNKGLHVNLRSSAGAEITPATDATHDGASSATGPQSMARATTDLDAITAVSDGDAVKTAADTLGRQITVIGCGTNNRLRGYLANTDGASTALTGMGAQGAGIIIEVYSFIVTNSSTTDVTVDIRDGTAGSVLTTLPAPATSDTLGGAVINLQVPITFTANTAVAMDASAAATTVYVTAIGCSVK